MQIIPLYQTTGISDFKIRRIRSVARSGKTVGIEGQDECLKTMKREERLLDSECGGRQESLVGFATRLSFSDGR